MGVKVPPRPVPPQGTAGATSVPTEVPASGSPARRPPAPRRSGPPAAREMVKSALPTNLYGPGHNFDLNASHVLPALLRKRVEAKEQGAPHVQVWGSGRPLREF